MVTTTLSPHPGGASVTVHVKQDKNFRLIFEAAITGDPAEGTLSLIHI